MGMSHADQLAHAGMESGVVALRGQLREVDAVPGEELLRQPAGPAAAVLPDVLQDVRHLQPLCEGYGETMQCRAPLRDARRVAAKQLGEHFTHDTRDIVAVAVQVTCKRQTAATGG